MLFCILFSPLVLTISTFSTLTIQLTLIIFSQSFYADSFCALTIVYEFNSTEYNFLFKTTSRRISILIQRDLLAALEKAVEWQFNLTLSSFLLSPITTRKTIAAWNLDYQWRDFASGKIYEHLRKQNKEEILDKSFSQLCN